MSAMAAEAESMADRMDRLEYLVATMRKDMQAQMNKEFADLRKAVADVRKELVDFREELVDVREDGVMNMRRLQQQLDDQSKQFNSGLQSVHAQLQASQEVARDMDQDVRFLTGLLGTKLVR
jgi:predicted  nucleic acid-binding Zn-ribbon protein